MTLAFKKASASARSEPRAEAANIRDTLWDAAFVLATMEYERSPTAENKLRKDHIHAAWEVYYVDRRTSWRPVEKTTTATGAG